MNLRKIEPLTLALVVGLAAALYYKHQAAKKEAYKCGGCGY